MSNRHHLGEQPRTLSSTIVRPYGDTTGDGMVQLSFTLPLPHDKRAEGCLLYTSRCV